MYVQLEKDKYPSNASIQADKVSKKRNKVKEKNFLPGSLYGDEVIQRVYQGDEQVAIQAVTQAMNAPPQMQNFALVYHPPTLQQSWQYTRTVFCNVQVPGQGNPDVSVRGHIHYTGGVAGPGNMWVSGIQGFSFPTPNAVVQQFNQVPSLQDRQAAVNAYNTNHQNANIPVPVA